MTSEPRLRSGWCPGALTPMQTGDGWLVRVRPQAGSYSLPQLAAISEAANRCGNGEIDLTNRANLQIRGLSANSVLGAQAILSAVGLIDDDAAVEAVRNVVVSPMAGIDPDAYDARPLARALEAEIIADERLKGLPGKFGFAVDGGGAFALPPELSDIILRTNRDGGAIELAGAAGPLVVLPEREASGAARSLANVFVGYARATPSARRMRDMVKCIGAAAIYEMAGLTAQITVRTPLSQSQLPVGSLGPVDAPWALGIGLPYGRISAVALSELVRAASECGVTELRPSHQRALIVPLNNSSLDPIRSVAKALGLIVDAGDPRLVMDVCPGAPACMRGTTRTREDADRLAAMLKDCVGSVRSLHVSGCSKGCAHQGPAQLTLVARNGLYDIIRNGTVSDSPSLTGIPGERLAIALTTAAGDPHAARPQ